MTGEINLRNFFEVREEEIIATRKSLLVELEELREARSAIERLQKNHEESKHNEKLTIKDMIRSVLRRNPEGGTSDQVIFWINQLHDVEVARTSLSPQLSRLKSDGEVDLQEENGFWMLSRDFHRFDSSFGSDISSPARRHLLRMEEQKRRRK